MSFGSRPTVPMAMPRPGQTMKTKLSKREERLQKKMEKKNGKKIRP